MSVLFDLEKIQTAKLANGLTVVTERMPHVRSVSAGIWVRAGSRYESGSENGIAHFLEHMLFQGTATRSAEQIAREVDSIGGNLDAFTSKELVCYNGKMLDEHVPIAFDILSDLVLNPLLREQDIVKEKSVILEELKMEVDNPEYLIHDIFSESFWRGNALGKPILGTKKTVTNFTREMIDGFFRKHYIPSSTVITAAGNVDHDKFMKLVESRFGSMPAATPVPLAPIPATNAELNFKNKRSLEQVQLCLGVPCHPLPHAKRFPTYVLNTVLGGGMSSRLFQNIREKRGLAYAVLAEQYLYRDSGCLSVYAGTSLAHTPELIRLVLQEFRDLKERPVPHEELRRAKDNLKGSFMLGLESTSSRMTNLARQHIYFGRFASMDETLESIESVTSNDVQALANEFFLSDRIALTVLGRLNGFALTRDQLVC